ILCEQSGKCPVEEGWEANKWYFLAEEKEKQEKIEKNQQQEARTTFDRLKVAQEKAALEIVRRRRLMDEAASRAKGSAEATAWIEKATCEEAYSQACEQHEES